MLKTENPIDQDKLERKMKDKFNQIIDLINVPSNRNLKLSLFQGDAGILLFFSTLALTTLEEKYFEQAESILNDIFDKLEKEGTINSFASGLAGIGWVLEYMVQNDIVEANTNEILREADVIVYEWMIEQQQIGNYDYFHGAIGAGFYFLKRVKSNKQLEKYVVDLLDLLMKNALIQENGFTKWVQITNGINKTEPNINIGISHGISSILVLMVKAFHNGIMPELTRKYIQSTTSYIVSLQHNFNDNQNHFPSSISLNGRIEHRSRFAWCYGDLGVCCALWHANTVLKNKDIESIIINVLLDNSRIRIPDATGIFDCSFCHGSIGPAYIFRKFYNRFERVEFLTASEYWYEQTLEMAKFDDGLAGYKSFTGLSDEFQKTSGLIEGISGIAACMILPLFNTDNLWDEVFLIS